MLSKDNSSKFDDNITDVESESLKKLIKKYWLKRIWASEDSFHLYIDSPFCVQQCRFCMLNPTIINAGESSIFRAYYRELINEIKSWAKVISSRMLDSVYFGGGTSSLMAPATMRKVFNSIPNFSEIKSKCFECDPMSLTNMKIKVLIEFGFTYVSFGIQTLDEFELQRQGRVNPTLSKLRELTAHLRENGVHVSYDVMAFLDDHLESDIARLKADCRVILGSLGPTAVDIYPMQPKLEGSKNEVLAKVAEFRNVLIWAKNEYPDYRIAGESDLSRAPEYSERYRNYFLLNVNPREYFAHIKRYSCSEPTSAPDSQNTLGLGGYGPRHVYSYMDGGEISYRSKFNAKTNTFVYF